VDSIDHAKGITTVRERDLQHARTEAVQGFGDDRLAALRCDRDRTEEYAFGSLGKFLEVFGAELIHETGRVFRVSAIPNSCCHI